MDFFRPFSLEKIRGKNPLENPRQNSNRNLGVSRPKSTLQGSCLELLIFQGSGEFKRVPRITKEIPFGSKKTNKQETHKHFSDGPCGTIVPGTNPHPSQGQTGQNGDFTVELNRQRPVCPNLSQGRGSRLSQGRFLFVPDTVPQKMFMFIGFFLNKFHVSMDLAQYRGLDSV